MSDGCYFGLEGEPITVDEWVAIRRRGQTLAHTDMPTGEQVITVWLGLAEDPTSPGPPLIFGTAVGRGHQLDEVRRYATKAEALAGHEEIVDGLG